MVARYKRAAFGILVALALALAFGSMAHVGVGRAYASYDSGYLTTQGSASLSVAAKAKKYKVIYKLNGGKQARKQVKSIKAGNTLDVLKLKVPKRSGYAFVNWYRNAKLTKKAISLKGTSKKSKRTVYAKWVKARNYKITYKLNGGTLVAPYQKKFRNTTTFTNLPKAVCLGYTFVGWYADKNLTKPVEFIARGVTKNQVLYAKWEPVEYSITYNPDGGTLPDDCVRTYSALAPANVLPTPEKDGYSFMGWYSDRRFVNPVDSIPATERGNKILYAKWRKHVLVAHRGLVSEEAPENSIQAFRDAADRGFTEIETDVRFTSDGVAVLIHDATLPLIVDGVQVSTAVSDLTYDELQEAECESPQAGEDGRNLATFKEGLKACSDMGLRMTVHMKTAAEQELDTLMALVGECGMKDAVRWFTSDLAVLTYIKGQMPTAHFVYSHSFTKQAADEAIELASGGADVEVNNYRTSVTASKMKYYKQNHVPVRTWGYSDETKLAGLDPYVSTVLVDGLVADHMPDPVVY